MSLNNLPENYMYPYKYIDTDAFKNNSKVPNQIFEENKANLSQVVESDLTTRQPHQEECPMQGRPKPRKDMKFVPDSNHKIDWSPLAEITGTRPALNKYSNNRYSVDEWRNYNAVVLDCKKIKESNILQYNSRTAAMSALGHIDKVRQENNERLKQRAKDIFKWKVEVEIACKAITKEIELFEIERQRIKVALKVLMLPESICKECIELRSTRAQTDLVEDLPELRLRKEMDLITEVKEIIRSALTQADKQLTINKAAKHKIEYDWCDKTTAHNTETINLGLSNKSNTIMFIPGATKFVNNTAPMMYYEYYCRENIENVESVRQASADLRSSLNSILINNGKKLREQADKTDTALAETVAYTTELLAKMKEHQRRTLKSLIDIKELILNLQNYIRKTDNAMKLAQTRLDNRNTGRPHQENVRDLPQYGLIKEVKTVHENVTSLLSQLQKAEKTKKDLIEKRNEIERNMTYNRNTLIIDRDRIGMIRSHYPTASELAGL